MATFTTITWRHWPARGTEEGELEKERSIEATATLPRLWHAESSQSSLNKS